MVRGLSKFYRLQHVSIFKVNQIRARCNFWRKPKAQQADTCSRAPIGKDIRLGLLGRAFSTGEVVLLDNAQSSDQLTAIYKVGSTRTRSELCRPVRLANRIVWIINLEDSRINAFRRPEIKMLKRVVQELEKTLERLFQKLVFEQIFETATDGVIITDARGRITRCNAAALDIFQVTPTAGLLGR